MLTAHPRLDPKTKFQIKQALEGAMYDPTERRFSLVLRNIIVANTVACKFSHESFSYKGQFYNLEATIPRYKNQRLMPELHLAMDEYLMDRTNLELFEKPYVVGLFNRMLNMTNSVYDYLELLPPSMHRPIRELNIPPEFMLPRTLADEQVEAFKTDHADWISMLKKRMVLDLVL